mgnify:CR=1 FL=1
MSGLATQKLQEIEVSIAHLVLAREELTRLVEFRCDRLLGCSCGQADCPVHAEGQAADEMGQVAPALQIVRGRPTGLLAGGVAAAACAICCAPLIGGLLAALGIRALTVAVGPAPGGAGGAAAATGGGGRGRRPGPGRQPSRPRGRRG